MLHRTLLFSFVISFGLLSAPAAQTMSWNFWTKNNYRNTFIAGGGVALAYLLWSYATAPKTPEECYKQAVTTVHNLHADYDAKIAAFERGYGITASDLATKNEELVAAQNEWRASLDEKALAGLGVFSGNWRSNIRDDVSKLSQTKIELKKLHRACLEDAKKASPAQVALAQNIEKLLSDGAMLFLQMSFLKDCVEHNKTYLDFLVREIAMTQKYAHVINVSTPAHLKQTICKHSSENAYPYIKFIQGLTADVASFNQTIQKAENELNTTKLFQRAQQLHQNMQRIERNIYADKALLVDLRDGQAKLLKHMRQKTKDIGVSVQRAQNEAERTRSLDGRLSLAVAAYVMYQNAANNHNAIDHWEMDNLQSLSKKIHALFTDIQKARSSKHAFAERIDDLQELYDNANLSVMERIHLFNEMEAFITKVDSVIKSMQDVEQKAIKFADDLYDWARKNAIALI